MDPDQLTTEEAGVLKQQMVLMPKEIKDLFGNDQVKNTAQGLATVYELTDEQAFALENEVALTLLGLELISDLPNRIKVSVGVTDERLENILDDLTVAILTPETINTLKHYEQTVQRSESEQSDRVGAQVIKSAPAPQKVSIPKPPEPKPGITANPVSKAKPEGKMMGLNEKQKVDVPTGKMVGLKQDQAESSVKGMRTMRGDISKLRGSDEGGETSGESTSNFTKPFKGS